LSPEPVTIYLSSADMSQLNTEEDSLDYKNNRNQHISKNNNNKKDYLRYESVAHLEYGSAVRCAPRIKQIVFARRHKPFTTRRKAQRKHARLVQMQLVFVRFEGVQHFDVGVLHADCQPFAGRTITQREYLCGKKKRRVL